MYNIRDQQLKIGTERVAEAVSLAFQAKDCQAAAYLLGAMSHFIADAAFYTHLIDNTIHHRAFLKKVDHLSDNPYSSSTPKRASDFFNIIEAYDAFNSGVKEKPGQATYLTGLDTRYGNAYQMSFSTRIFFDAFWLDEKAPMGGDPKFFLSTDNSLLDYWTSANRPSSGEAKLILIILNII